MRRARRIGLSEADRLVAGARPDPGMEGMAELLRAARTPTPGADLAGEGAAVAGFLAARQRAVPTAPSGSENRARGSENRARVPLLVRATAMKAALAIAILAFGGTALAARTGSLPTAMQERAHAFFSDVGVPAPAPSAQPTRTVSGGVTTPAVPSPTPTPSRTGSPRPTAVAALALCRVWDAAGQDPPGKAVPAETRRALAAAAGGVPKIDEFCDKLLGEPSSAPPTSKSTGPSKSVGPGKTKGTGKPTAKPSHTGNGKGQGTGR
jgi:hypothetical protein